MPTLDRERGCGRGRHTQDPGRALHIAPRSPKVGSLNAGSLKVDCFNATFLRPSSFAPRCLDAESPVLRWIISEKIRSVSKHTPAR